MKKRKNEGKKEGLKSRSSDRPLAGPRGSHQFCERLHARRAAVRRSRSRRARIRVAHARPPTRLFVERGRAQNLCGRKQCSFCLKMNSLSLRE